MNKRGFIAALLALFIAGGTIFIAVYLSNERANKLEKKFDNKTSLNSSKIINVTELGEENNETCKLDSDCVPASCCHPSSCTTKDKAPECKKILCTQVCAPNSFDCGQGSCACVNNKCEAIFK
jgi:hypothetical protein